MPEENGIGYSGWTSEKQRIFNSLLKVNLRMWDSILNDSYKNKAFEGNYTFFDITAGCGVHEVYGDGSPLIFLDCIKLFSKPWCAHFVEINKVNAAKLELHCRNRSNGNYHIHNRDNEEFLHDWMHDGLNKVPGLLYCDPTGQIPKFSMLAEFSEVWISVDLLIAYSATNKKRAKVAFGHKSLIEEIKNINKKNILVRTPYAQHQWTFLYMTNGPAPTWKKEGFHLLCSERGKEIMEILNFTEAERKDAEKKTLFELPGIS